MCKKNDRKIDILQGQIKQRKSNVDCTSQMDNHKISFYGFKGILTDTQLSTLRLVDQNSRGDSTFVKNCVEFLYFEDLTKLQNKSLTGNSRTGLKEPVTPQKLNQIKSMYNERLNYMQLSDADKLIREKKLNRHINFAIININNLLKNHADNKKKINVAKIK